MEGKRIAFVASGGGMSCAYGAGVAWALQESGIKPGIFIGSSGSAGTVSYFACGQAEVAARLWQEEVTNPRVLQRHPLRLDVDFIIDSMHKRFTLDESKLRSTQTSLFLAATHRKSGLPRFFSNREPFNWYEVMRASMAVPFVYGRKINLGGEMYYDGDVSTSLEESIALAEKEGAEVIYVCDTRFQGSLWQSAREVGLIPLLSLDFIKTLMGDYRMRTIPKWSGSAKLIWIKPSQKLPTGLLNNSPKAIQESINVGYKDAEQVLRQQKY